MRFTTLRGYSTVALYVAIYLIIIASKEAIFQIPLDCFPFGNVGHFWNISVAGNIQNGRNYVAWHPDEFSNDKTMTSKQKLKIAPNAHKTNSGKSMKATTFRHGNSLGNIMTESRVKKKNGINFFRWSFFPVLSRFLGSVLPVMLALFLPF